MIYPELWLLAGSLIPVEARKHHRVPYPLYIMLLSCNLLSWNCYASVGLEPTVQNFDR
jgi:hypothetical protein